MILKRKEKKRNSKTHEFVLAAYYNKWQLDRHKYWQMKNETNGTNNNNNNNKKKTRT